VRKIEVWGIKRREVQKSRLVSAAFRDGCCTSDGLFALPHKAEMTFKLTLCDFAA